MSGTSVFLDLDFGTVSLLRWPIIGIAVLVIFIAHRHLGNSNATFRQLLGELAILTPAYFAYYAVRGFAEGREAQAFHTAINIIELEQALGIFWEPDLQNSIMRFGWLVDLANWTYIWGFWPVIVMAAVWLFMLHREAYSVYRNAFMISGAIGLIIFMTMPVAPPRFMDAWGFVDTVAERSAAYRSALPPAFVNQYAAMPSLHFGWNLLVGIAIFQHSNSIFPKIVGVALPLVMFASIVLTANHYIIDGLAGGTLALLGLGSAILLRQFMQKRSATSPPALAGQH